MAKKTSFLNDSEEVEEVVPVETTEPTKEPEPVQGTIINKANKATVHKGGDYTIDENGNLVKVR